MTAKREPMLDRWGRASDGLSNAAIRYMYESWFRVEWDGIEHIPPSGGALLVANHAGMLPVDGGIIAFGVEDQTGRPVHALAHHGFWRYPFVGTTLSRIGAVVGHPDNAHRLLSEEKGLVLVMPEGAKGPLKPARERYRLQRFGRAGFVETAMRAGVPIVPIALMGTEDTTPTLTTLRVAGQDVPITLNMLLFGPLLGAVAQFPAKIRAQALPPIHFDAPTDLDHYDHSVLMDHAENIRTQLQTALGRMLNARKSVWEG
jgi:1-acyl-sn-glycerol-3-phosphate acyltransferase